MSASIEQVKAEGCDADRAGVDTSVAPIESITSEMILSGDKK